MTTCCRSREGGGIVIATWQSNNNNHTMLQSFSSNSLRMQHQLHFVCCLRSTFCMVCKRSTFCALERTVASVACRYLAKFDRYRRLLALDSTHTWNNVWAYSPNKKPQILMLWGLKSKNPKLITLVSKKCSKHVTKHQRYRQTTYDDNTMLCTTDITQKFYRSKFSALPSFSRIDSVSKKCVKCLSASSQY